MITIVLSIVFTLLLLWIAAALIFSGTRLSYFLLIAQGIMLLVASFPLVLDVLFQSWPQYNYLFWGCILVAWVIGFDTLQFLKKKQISGLKMLLFRI